MEVVNGRECKVFSASNVELVTKTRTEHLSPEDKTKIAGSGFLFNSLLAVGQHVEEATTPPVWMAIISQMIPITQWFLFKLRTDALRKKSQWKNTLTVAST